MPIVNSHRVSLAGVIRESTTSLGQVRTVQSVRGRSCCEERRSELATQLGEYRAVRRAARFLTVGAVEGRPSRLAAPPRARPGPVSRRSQRVPSPTVAKVAYAPNESATQGASRCTSPRVECRRVAKELESEALDDGCGSGGLPSPP